MKHSQLREDRIATARADLIRYVDYYDRCNDVMQRLVKLDPESKIDDETVKFLNEYLEGVPSTEALIFQSDTMTSVENCLKAIGRVLAFIFRKIWELFKWIFDQYYRARKEFLDIRSFLVSIDSPRFRAQFENIYCQSIILRKDVMNLISQSMKLCMLIQSTVGAATAEHIDVLLIQFRQQAGFDMQLMSDGVNDKFIDLTMAFQPVNNMTIANAGWNVDSFIQVIESHIDLVTRIVDLKKTEKNLRKEAAAIEDRVQQAVAAGQKIETVRGLQDEAAFKVRKAKIVLNSLSVLNKRTLGISNVLRTIAKEAKKFK